MSNRHAAPGSAAAFRVATPDGAVLPVYAWGGPAPAPALLFGHANGLAAGSYAPWLGELAAGLRVFAFDARGHGGSRWPAGALETVFAVDRFADDLALVAAAIAARLAGAPLNYTGHSLNAAAALRLAARDAPLPWSGTLLFEPPIFPPASSPHYAEASDKQIPLITRSAARRVLWPSPEALADVLRGRGAFARFRPDLLDAHCRATLKPVAEGGYTLCCPPAVESAIFRSHRDADTWQRLPQVRAAIHLVAGDPALPDRGWVSACMAEMAAQLTRARLTLLPGAGHMMIFEQPDACRDLVVAAVSHAQCA
ncbi:MAG TPA: alpha/beta hydrolase [Stellaceae bacterium]|nr:alpha/beta hydrolase [Stellaceae bacterium]